MTRKEQTPAARAAPTGWRSRGYLPHFDGGSSLPQSVTFRLADSVPRSVVEHWHDELASRPTAEREHELRKRIEKYLDAGYGARHLRNPRVGELVQNALQFFDALRYRLHAWAVMPNHVHVLFTPGEDGGLADILGSWKSYTSKEANKLLGRTGQYWKEEYFDRFIRDASHFDSVVEYIEYNPVHAGLCSSPADWPFGSARLRREVQAAGTAAVPGKKT
jgi:REP element-mobilizing transposase RayT